jgi:hypothetical protein
VSRLACSLCLLVPSLLATAARADSPIEDPEDPRTARERAKALFELEQTSSRDVARAAVQAARKSAEVRLQEHSAGRGSLDILVDVFQVQARAEEELDGSPARRRALAEWLFGWAHQALLEMETLLEMAKRGEARRLRAAALLQSRLAWLEAAGRVPARQARPQREPPGLDDPGGLAGSKEVARARFEVERTSASTLAANRLLTARRWVEVRASEYRSGRGTLDVLAEAVQRCLEAELTVERPAARSAALRQAWSTWWLLARLVKGRFEYGRENAADHFSAQVNALTAAIRLRSDKPPTGREGGAPPSPWPLEPAAEKELAKAARALSQTSVPELASQRAEAAREALRGRVQEYQAGRGILVVLLEQAKRLHEAETALGPTAARASADRCRSLFWMAEELITVRFAASRVSARDWYAIQAELRLFELRLRRERDEAAKAKSRPYRP